MGLFSKLTTEKLAAAAVRSQVIVEPKKQVNARSIKEQITAISEKVKEHFPDSKAELITSVEQLHTYIDHFIVCGIGAIDTETTGLDRQKDHIVGWSMYFPDGTEVYIPCKHIVPIFDTPYNNQLTYEQCGAELQRLVVAKTKIIMANADFDLAMVWNDFKTDLIPIVFYDVLLAWRCLKENEKDNSLKGLYTKYIAKGTIDRMKFDDFFSAELYPYCDPQIAKLYAAADARYTYELYVWQMQYLTKDSPLCKKYKFEAISDLCFSIEFPLIKVCQLMHRRGVYLEQSVADMLQRKYKLELDEEANALRAELQDILDNPNTVPTVPSPFGDIKEFNPNSNVHVEWLVYDVLKLDTGSKKRTTKKEILGQFNVPIIKNILKYRSMVTLIGTFVDKLPKVAAESPDHKIHCEFKSIGADTGRFSSKQPNMQNIPSKHGDIRQMFRASPGYVMMSSDYSQQEPKLTAFVSQDPLMIETFKSGKDIYATIASIGYGVPYEDCLEFHPETHEYQPDGKKRRGTGKVLVLGRPSVYAPSVGSLTTYNY